MGRKFEKALKKIAAILLVFCFVLPAFATSASNLITETRQTGDPYSLMYDSNEKLAERIENMPEFDVSYDTYADEETASVQDIAGNDALDRSGRDISAPNTEGAGQQKVKEDAIGLAKDGNVDEIMNLDISDERKTEISSAADDVKEDRYIVKYRTQSGGDISSLLDKKSDFSAVQNSERSDKMETIVLNEKVNPKDFAEALDAAGAGKVIEYIQPDFTVYYSAEEGTIGLEIEAVTDVSDETPAGEQDSTLDRNKALLPDVPEDTTQDDTQNATEDATQEVTEGITQDEAEDVSEEELPTDAGDYANVIVAVIDTGIDTTHPSLVDYIWNNSGEIAGDGIDNDGNGYIDDAEGWNFYDDSSEVYDSTSPLQSAHGTHIAGIITLEAADYNVTVMPLKVFGESGAYTSDIIEAIEYAEANGAQIVNCSFGSADENLALQEAIEASEMLFVAAVGNARSDLEENPIYPASFDLDNIISVTSTNADGGLSYYSNYSTNLVDIAALGRDVYSTLPNGEYGNQSGTSMSAAQVSGAAAAVLSSENTLNNNGLKERLILTADMLSNLQDTVTDGRQLNLYYAVSGLEQTEILEDNPADDFNVNGYNPTQDEFYQLYTSGGDVVQVAAGYNHSLVLKEDGTVWAWGKNNYGQCGNGTTSYYEALTQVIGLTNVLYIATINYHSLAVKSNGTVWAWGYNNCGQLGDGTTTNRSIPVQVSGLTDVVQVAGGYYHSLAVKADGTVRTWGYNNYGQLGDGTTTYRTTPVQVSGLTDAVQVAGGAYHSLAVKSDGTVWAWGYNNYGQLGNGTTTTRTTPVQVSGLTDVVQVSGGCFHSLATKSDGTVWAWGCNSYGRLGDGTTTNRTTPVQVSGLTDVVQVAGGYYHSLAVKADGTVRTWGYNNYGQLGDGTTTYRTTPVQVSGLTDAVQVAGGAYHSLAVESDGTVWAWGDNYYCQLGNGIEVSKDVPVQSNGITGVVSVVAGCDSSRAVKSDDTMWAWGCNEFGYLGDGTSTDTSIPVQVIGLTSVVCSDAGRLHSLAVKSDGTVWVWGNNDYHQLGIGYEVWTPGQVIGLADVVSAAAGAYFNVALKSDGTVWAWGYNDCGQLGDGTTTYRTTPVQVSGLTNVVSVAAGNSYGLAVKSDGTVWSWGYNSYGCLGDGTTTMRATPVQVSGLTDVVQVAGGVHHSLAVKSDGTVWAWGYNYYSQLGDGTTTTRTMPVQVSGLTNVVSVSAGDSHSLALKSDGTVLSWGKNTAGQLGDGTTTSRSTPVQVSRISGIVCIDAGAAHSLAVKSDGTMWSWGSDDCQQLGRCLYSYVPIQSQIYLTGNISFLEDFYAATIPNSSSTTITVSTQGIDEYGESIDNTDVTYSLANIYAGVTINSDTGVITVTDEAIGGYVQINAVYGTLSCSTILNLYNEIGVAFTANIYTASIPNSGNTTITVTAQATDELGQVIEDASCLYSLANSYTGVSIDSSTGVVTITDETQVGSVQINAEYGTLCCGTTLYLLQNSEILTTTTANETYNVSVTASSITDFSGRTFTLTYDDAVLEPADLCAFTYSNELTGGAVGGTDITILSISDGVITFEVNKTIPTGKSWSGVVNVFKFTAISYGQATVSIT